jgi:hypothetical protein
MQERAGVEPWAHGPCGVFATGDFGVESFDGDGWTGDLWVKLDLDAFEGLDGEAALPEWFRCR